MAKPIAIHVEGVSKRFVISSQSASLKSKLTGFGRTPAEDFWAVKDVTVDIPAGSMLGVIGRNGSGKSTFLRVLSGIYRPSEGEVKINGRVTALLELGAGFHPDLSGRENVYMNGAVVGLDRDYMDSVMDDIVDMADIGSFIDAPIETYSSGMRARLGFAVSVQLKPEILLADEITAVGDIAFKLHGDERMQELRDNGVTIVQVSHNLSMLQSACDKVLWLHQGKVMGYGEPDVVISDYIDFAAKMVEERNRARLAEGNALRPRWFTVAEFAPTKDSVVTMGCEMRLILGMAPDEPVKDPAIRMTFTRANGSLVEVESDFTDMPDVIDGPLTVSALIPGLPLPNGRYRVELALLSGEEVVARKRLPLEVTLPDGSFSKNDPVEEWSVR